MQNIDDKRLNVSLGLIATYGLALFFFFDLYSNLIWDNPFLVFVSIGVLFGGIGSVMLFLWIINYALNLKYRNKSRVSVYDFQLKFPDKLEKVLYDQGIEVFISGFFYSLVQMPPFLIIEKFSIENILAKLFIYLITPVSIIFLLNKSKVIR